MDAISIEIGLDSWYLLHVRASLKGARAVSQKELGGTLQERASAVVRHIAENGLSAIKVGIVLSREVSICKSFELPAPGLDAVEGIVRFEIEKHLPLALTETYYGFQVLGKYDNTYSVVVGAASKRQVDEIIDIFSSAGVSISFICFWHEAVLNSLVHFGEIGKESKKVFVRIYGHEMTLDVFRGFMLVYSKRVETEGLLPAQVFQRELAVMAAYLRCEQDDLSIILSTDPAGHLALPDGLQGKISLLNPKGMLEPSGLAAFGGALAATGSGKCRINFLKGSGAEQGKYLRSAVFSVAALVLVCLVAVSYLAKDIITLNRLDRAISRHKSLKDGSGAEASNAETTGAKIAVLKSISGNQSAIALELLREITEIVPEDSWLTSVEYKQGIVVMEGLSGDSSSLLIKLENSKLLDDFEFVAPVVRVSKGKEKFRIKARVKNLKEGRA